jgi:hypothetical protein
MTSSNVSRTHQYLQAVASMGSFENVADFYSPDVLIREFPNRIAPEGASAAPPTCAPPMNRAGRSCTRKPIECSGSSRLVMS